MCSTPNFIEICKKVEEYIEIYPGKIRIVQYISELIIAIVKENSLSTYQNKELGLKIGNSLILKKMIIN